MTLKEAKVGSTYTVAKITGAGHTHGRNVLFPVKPVSDKPKFEHGFLYDVFRLVLIRQIETRDVYEFAS